MKTFTKYYTLAGITIKVESDLPILNTTFDPGFKIFEAIGPGEDNIFIHHHFEPNHTPDQKSWEKIYDKLPWKIYHADNCWMYKRIHEYQNKSNLYCTAFLDEKHTHAEIFHEPIQKNHYLKGNLDSLTLFPTDEILLARVLSDRNGCMFHSSGVLLKNKGFLFLGHSGYGKSTISRMLAAKGGKIICDDRAIVRKNQGGILMYGSWCHGKEPIFSAESSLLNGIFFIAPSDNNKILRSEDSKYNIYQLISFIIKPMVTRQWWNSNFGLIESIAKKIPCYHLWFDKKGEIADLIKKL